MKSVCHIIEKCLWSFININTFGIVVIEFSEKTQHNKEGGGFLVQHLFITYNFKIFKGENFPFQDVIANKTSYSLYDLTEVQYSELYFHLSVTSDIKV